jgi:hypothetical protein
MKYSRRGGFRLRPDVFAVMFLMAPAVAFAQDVGARGPLVVERVHSPLVVAPDYKVTDLDGEFGQLAGAYVGRSIEDALFIGGAGYWLVNGSRGDTLAYGGVLAGWSMPLGSRIRLGGRGLVGLGRATLATELDFAGGLAGGPGWGSGGIRPGGTGGVTRFGAGGRRGTQVSTIRVRARDDFFVFEPQADVLTRITGHIGLHWAAGYRLTALTDALGDRVDGETGSVALQLEW